MGLFTRQLNLAAIAPAFFWLSTAEFAKLTLSTTA